MPIYERTTMQNSAKNIPKRAVAKNIPRYVGVMLFEQFSNHCLANAVEPLRAANTLLGWQAYEWQFLTLDGTAVTSSSGLPVAANQSLVDARGGVLMVLPSYGFRELTGPRLARALRAAARRFDLLVGLDAGAWLLADAGLLAGRRATIHWEELEEFAETFPEVQATRARVVCDGNRWSCAGAATAFDLALDLISADHGALTALEVAAFLMHGEKGAQALPDVGLPVARNRMVTAAISAMRDTTENPLNLSELANRLNCSKDQLKRAFAQDLAQSPGQIYRNIRLTLARRFVENTGMSVAEISVRCGYGDAAAMTRAFRTKFGATPRELRAGP